MPGLILVAGHPRADDTARAAAAPLLRHPWEPLSVEGEGDVSVAVAGERGGAGRRGDLLVAVEGEVVGAEGVLPADAALDRMADAYRRGGARLEGPDGEYAAAVWDTSLGRGVLVTDAVGVRPIYLAEGLGYTLAAGELKALVAGGLRPRLSLQGAAEMLSYEKPWTDATMLADTRRLGGGVVLPVDASGGAGDIHRHFRFRVEPERMDLEEAIEELSERMVRAVGRRLDGETALALSGGLDSRWLAHEVAALDPATAAVTYGTSRSDELRLAQGVAHRAGLPHRALPLEPGYLAEGAAQTVWLADGSIRCFHAHHLALRRLRAENRTRAIMIGLVGDDTVRLATPKPAGSAEEDFARVVAAGSAKYLPDGPAERALHPAFAAQIRGRAFEGYAASLAAVDGVSRTARLSEFYWRPQATIFADHLAPRDPFGDREVLELCRRLPLVLRHDGLAERTILKRHTDLAWLRSPKDGVPPGLTGRPRRLALGAVGLGRSVRHRADRLVGPRWTRTRAGFSDYSADLRAAGGRPLDVLLEERTLDRRQFDRDWIEARIAETLRGRSRNTLALSVMLTLELFQRLFIDGDGAPAEHPEAAAETRPRSS